MAEPNKETREPVDVERQEAPANTTDNAEEWVRRKIVPPVVEDDPEEGDDRSPGGSGRSVVNRLVDASEASEVEAEPLSEKQSELS